jgi:hypothetical protein
MVGQRRRAGRARSSRRRRVNGLESGRLIHLLVIFLVVGHGEWLVSFVFARRSNLSRCGIQQEDRLIDRSGRQAAGTASNGRVVYGREPECFRKLEGGQGVVE